MFQNYNFGSIKLSTFKEHAIVILICLNDFEIHFIIKNLIVKRVIRISKLTNCCKAFFNPINQGIQPVQIKKG
jgi:hypothetical protein